MSEAVDSVSKEQLIADFRTLVADAEALLKATANQGGEELAAVRARAEESLSSVKDRIDQEQVALIARTREVARATDAYVYDNPWTAVGIAAGLGLLIGLLSARR